MNLFTRSRELLYRAGSGLILTLVRAPGLSTFLARGAKVLLRHWRLFRHLRVGGYDAVIDGGANIGEFAAIVRAAKPDLPLLCVEPHPGAAATLRERGFRVVEAALWSRSGTATLAQPTAAATSASLLATDGDAVASWEVETVRVDQLPLVGERVLLKLDLQGAEVEALAGVGDRWESIAGVLLEVGYGAAGNYEELRSDLSRRGFFEAATFNELDDDGRAIEADKLWLRA